MPTTKVGQLADRRLSAAERVNKALEARLDGKDWDTVARIGGYANKSNACRAVMKALADRPAHNVEELRQVENARLDRMEIVAWEVLRSQHPFVSQGKIVGRYAGVERDPDTREVLRDHNDKPILIMEELEDCAPLLNAISTLLRIQERRAKLNGLDMPTKLEIDDHSVDTEIEELVGSFNLVPGLEGPGAGHPG